MNSNAGLLSALPTVHSASFYFYLCAYIGFLLVALRIDTKKQDQLKPVETNVPMILQVTFIYTHIINPN